MKLIIGAVALALLAGNAVATPVSGTDGMGTPTIAGQTGIVNFDSTALATRSSLTSGAVTISGIGGSIRVANDYPGQYNGRGAAYLDNDQGDTNGFRFDFASIVNAFAFNFGASDNVWTLTAFDASGHVLESVRAPITNGSNAGDYIGLADAGIKYATLTTSSSDWVFVDNFVYAAPLVRASAVPEPGSIALIGLGIAGVVAMRRRKGLA
ncbi:MAG: PEP-CTERM sorting domain-containing protein [Burkholderiaceae bacterium]